MPPQISRMKYGYLTDGKRIEVYTKTGRKLGEVERRRQPFVPEKYSWWIGDVRYARLCDAAAALEGGEG